MSNRKKVDELVDRIRETLGPDAKVEVIEKDLSVESEAAHVSAEILRVSQKMRRSGYSAEECCVYGAAHAMIAIHNQACQVLSHLAEEHDILPAAKAIAALVEVSDWAGALIHAADTRIGESTLHSAPPGSARAAAAALVERVSLRVAEAEAREAANTVRH